MPVPEGLAGMRVDAGLARLLGLSRNAVAAIAEEGGVELEFLGEEVSLVWTTDRAAKEALDNTVRRVNEAIAPADKAAGASRR